MNENSRLCFAMILSIVLLDVVSNVPNLVNQCEAALTSPRTSRIHSILIHLPIKQQLFPRPAAIFSLQLEDKRPSGLLTIVDEGIFWPAARCYSKNIKLAVWENQPHLYSRPPPSSSSSTSLDLHTQSKHTVRAEYTQGFVFDGMCSLSVIHCGQCSFSKGLEYDATFM